MSVELAGALLGVDSVEVLAKFSCNYFQSGDSFFSLRFVCKPLEKPSETACKSKKLGKIVVM